MKISNFIITFIFTLLICSCSQNKYKKELIGNWYSIDNPYTIKIQFKKDSIIVTDNRINKSIWKVNKDKIEFNYKPFMEDTIININLSYELNDKKNRLFTKTNSFITTDSIEFTYLKAENYLDFLFKKNGVKINLKEKSKLEYIPIGGGTINIFAFKNNDSIIAKTEFSSNLDSLDNDIKKLNLTHNETFNNTYNNYKETIEREYPESKIKSKVEYYNLWVKEFYQFQIFVDNQVPEKEISKIVHKLEKNFDYDIYEIFHTVESNIYTPVYELEGIKK